MCSSLAQSAGFCFCNYLHQCSSFLRWRNGQYYLGAPFCNSVTNFRLYTDTDWQHENNQQSMLVWQKPWRLGFPKRAQAFWYNNISLSSCRMTFHYHKFQKSKTDCAAKNRLLKGIRWPKQQNSGYFSLSHASNLLAYVQTSAKNADLYFFLLRIHFFDDLSCFFLNTLSHPCSLTFFRIVECL